MIEKQDVVKLKMPFPNISSQLAVKSHMYICHTPGENKGLLKIQSLKNEHRIKGYPCRRHYKLYGNVNSNPCRHDSFVDLDKIFNLNRVRIPKKLKTTLGIEDDCYKEMISELDSPENIIIDTEQFLTVNLACKIL